MIIPTITFLFIKIEPPRLCLEKPDMTRTVSLKSLPNRFKMNDKEKMNGND